MKLMFASLCWFLSMSGLAQVPSNEISDMVTAYPHSQIVQETEAEVEDHPLALGSMRKVEGIWAPETELRVNGQHYRLTQQIDEGHAAKEAFQYYRNRVLNTEARELFVCYERACGSSNAWANEHYDIKELYGLDGSQYYSIFEIVDEDNHLNYVSFYTVARGNRRVFAQVEWLKTQLVAAAAAAPNPDVVLQQLSDRGYYIVSGVSLADGRVDIKQDHLDALSTALSQRRTLRVRIVGHDYQRGELDQQRARSLRYAQDLRQKLIDAGIRENRLEVHGVGSLAPARASAQQDMRLEVILFQ